MPRRKTTRRTGRTSYSRRASGYSYGTRRKSSSRKRAVSKRSAASPRAQRVIIEVRQAPAVANPIEGLIAASKPAEAPRKAKF